MGDFREVIPVLRMYDHDATRRFYAEYLGGDIHEDLTGNGPNYWRVFIGGRQLHLSSHHGDGNPVAAVLFIVDDLRSLHARLHATGYPHMNPGLENEPTPDGLQMTLIDPASNLLRFFEPGGAASADA